MRHVELFQIYQNTAIEVIKLLKNYTSFLKIYSAKFHFQVTWLMFVSPERVQLRRHVRSSRNSGPQYVCHTLVEEHKGEGYMERVEHCKTF